MAVRRPSKALIEPALEFTIPSLHDSLQLDARIYNAAPRDPEAAGGLASGREGHVRGAIIAHPYAPTGGSQDDRVVMGIVETLVGSGWVVGTFNFRSASLYMIFWHPANTTTVASKAPAARRPGRPSPRSATTSPC